MSAIVEVQGLRKVYGRGSGQIVAVDRLDLTLGQAGTVHGFLGPNGSGKTTTIRCLLGLIYPTGGAVRVFGEDATRDFHKSASRVGAMVENPKLFPNFSGRKNLSLLASMAGIKKSQVDRVLQIVGLADRDSGTFDSYSLGMKQRLAIAAALLKDPELLILDEPANGLDPAGIAEMRLLIRGIARDGKAILVSSHQLAEIEQVCDDVTIIHNGHLIESGPLDQIRRHAGADSVVVKVPNRDAALGALAAAGVGAGVRPAADEIRVNIDANRASDVTRILAEAGIYLHGLFSERATLEAAFLNLTGTAQPPAPANGQPPANPSPTTSAQTAPSTPPAPAPAPAAPTGDDRGFGAPS